MKKNQKNKERQSRLPLYFSMALVGSACLCYFLIPDFQSFLTEAWRVLTSGDAQKIEEWVADFGSWGPIVLVIAMVVQMFLLVIPTIALMVVSVLAYGPVWGSIIIMGSVFAASSVGYVIGRYFGTHVVMKLLGKKTQKQVEGFIEKYGFWAIIVTRLNPFLSNDAISFVGGMLKMGYWKFIGATLVGIFPLTLFIALLGQDIDTMKTGLLWGSMVSLVVFLGYVGWDKYRKDA